jgi:hypothetical protein
MDSTTILAWWGAILAMVIAVVDLYKWQVSRFYIRVDVDAGWEGDDLVDNEIRFTVTNVGGQPTTIKGFALAEYSIFPLVIIGKPSREHNVSNKNKNMIVLALISPGEFWKGACVLDEAELKTFRAKGLYYRVYCSHRARPITGKIRQDNVLTGMKM